MKRLSLTLLAALLMALGATAARAAATDIASVPVMNVTGTGSIKPNIMLMLDDSGSMGWDYTPDQANDSGKCFDGATCISSSGSTKIFHAPYFSPEFNFQYYNPDLTYTPGVNSTGTSFGAQTSSTAVKTDPYGVQQTNQGGTSMSTENLTANYPDVVYCSVSSPTAAQLADGVTCKKNSAYTYPDPAGGTFTTSKRVNGQPYYYRIAATKYCSDANLTSCISATSPSGSYVHPAPLRWCSNAVTNFAYTNCQRNYDSTHTTPEFIGTVKPASHSAASYGEVKVTTAGTGYSITDMQVNGVSIIPSGTPVTGSTAANFATALATAINSHHSVPEYAACVGVRRADQLIPFFVSGDNLCTGTPSTTVTIFPQTASCGTSSATISGCTAQTGTVNDGKVITYSGPNVPGVAATGSITVGAGSAFSATYNLAGVDVGSATITTGPISFTGDLSTAAGRQGAAAAIAVKIGAGYSATALNGVVTITANATGAVYNGTLSLTPGATSAQATMTVGTINSGTTYTLDSISAGGTVITTGAVSVNTSVSGASNRRQVAASAIAAAIGLNGYSATASGGVVTISAPSGDSGNGTLTYVATGTGSPATGTATLTLGSNALGGTYKISNIKFGATTVASNVTCAGNASANVVAICVRDAINSAGTNFTATAASGVVTITASQAGTYANGTLTVTLAAAVKPTATFSVTEATNAVVNNLRVQAGGSCTTSISAAPGILTGSTSSSSNDSTVASRIAAKVGAAGYTATYTSGTSFPVRAPNSLLNGCTLSPTASSGTVAGSGTFSGGSDPIAVTAAGALGGGFDAGTPLPFTATTNFSGGTNTIPVSSQSGMSGGANGNQTATLSITNGILQGGVDGIAFPTRMNVGTFTRTDIVSCAGACYPKHPNRTDCAGAAGCTYNEEMTNFGNWYAYYRTRMQTMKSAASLAFNPLGASYRVGIAELSNVGYGGGVNMTPADFNAANRATWYGILLAANPSVATPLRTALDAIGKMYANQAPYNYAGAARVIQYPCQQNFVILTTDGLWNQSYSGNVGNNDNVENAARFCTKSGGCFDGITSGATVPSLADVALYWYNGGSNTGTVSLRPDLEPSVATPGVVPAGPSDPNTHLHMTTFTLGLGVNGLMRYEDRYDTAPSASGDYYKLITGAGGCPWNGGGTYVWPNPTSDSLQAVDDLWHAAVNGHGKYFSARDPAAVVSGLSAAIAAMAVRTGAASAAATSTPNVSQQDNDIFSATFTTVKWYGELFDQKIDPATGNVSSAIAWSSSNTLGTKVAAATDSRNIKMLDTATGNLKNFLYSELSATEKGWFDGKAASMVQYTSLSAADRAIANDGNNLVNWMRGQTQYADDIIYRAYTYTTTATPIPIVLGDIDTAKPAYLRDPRKSFGGAYAAYAATQKASRAATVFAAANDGMLHAFNASSGDEIWAYAPRITMTKLWRQAATDYGSNHQFSTDGSPEIADVEIGGAWKTMLVAGLNAGGRGYYALDVTDPTAPVAMWEFCADSTLCSKSDADLGLTFGNPQFGYWNNKWVVVVTSGYNNIPGTDGISSGDGVGYLYVLDAANGTVLKKVSTATGNAGTPSGLAKISAITANPQTDPVITYIYGGDNEGNLWRFDFTSAPAIAAPLKLATLGSAQPITTRPDVSLCQAGTTLHRVVLVGTGRLLGVSDTTTTGTQSAYLIKDSGTALGSLNGNATMVQQTLTGAGGTQYGISANAVNLNVKNGWYADLTLNTGERVNLDPKIVFSTAVVVTNLPSSGSACTVGGTSYNYNFDLCAGGTAAIASNVGGVLSSSSAAVGFIVVKLPSGTIKMIVTTADGSKLTGSVRATASAAPRKTGWRSLKK